VCCEQHPHALVTPPALERVGLGHNEPVPDWGRSATQPEAWRSSRAGLGFLRRQLGRACNVADMYSVH